jgi:hypothetical protein
VFSIRRIEARVIYLRVQPSSIPDAHDELARILSSHEDTELRRCFVVVEPGKHRIRRLQTQS